MSIERRTDDRRPSEIITLEDALGATYDDAIRWYADAINPVDAAEARVMGDTGGFVRAHGAVLTDERGDDYLDCLAGFGSVNLGHNHPELLAALDQVAQLPGFVQIWPSIVMPALAASLVRVAPGDLGKVFFCNSGSEAIEAAIKLARGGTRRTGLLSTTNAFHGKTMGALSVSGRAVYQEPFGPLLPGCERVPFGDLDALERALRTKAYGGFFVEPIQGEAGVILPPEGYLKAAEQLCRETGTLLVVDEVQTGMGRTGTLFACEAEGVAPDVLCLAKGLGGGLLPIGACLARTDVWNRLYGTRETSRLHTSTFGGGTRACAVALKTLEVLVRDRLPERAHRIGGRLIGRLAAIAERYRLIAEVRGRGLLIGIEFAAPKVAAGFAREYAGSVAAALLWREHRIVTINTLHNPNVMRIEPPLVITEEQADRVVDAMEAIARRHRSVLGATARVGVRSLRGRAATRSVSS
ncbi:MAG TPA: aminotransferase class III-fold pyridoxal phosphate-dependent enzyme [Euzebyales bacterium]|nr:aminotransferase class III-fold pyridoxal phosphate-dependent enzyme [Euzebyales bacterium]